MAYTALYRRFRPATFDEVKGQDHVVKTLRNQVRSGELQHAYLFCGTRGTGKTSVAKILAKAVNCENPVDGNPCGNCESCRAVAAGISMNVSEIDAASNNGVDNVREIIEEVRYRPVAGRYKVYIIDEVHMLSKEASNALLKTLEEPPDYVIFILATTEVGRLPVTVLSRCQRYDFRRVDTDTIAARLRELTGREGIEAEDRALRLIAQAADGSVRDSLSLLDRCISLYMDEPLTAAKALKALGEPDRSVYGELTECLLVGDAGRAVGIVGRQTASGIEIGQMVDGYLSYLRDLLIAASSSEEDAKELLNIQEEQLPELRDLASRAGSEVIVRYIRELSNLVNRMRYASNRRVLADITMIRLCRPEGDTTEEALFDRVRKLEAALDEIAEGGYALRETRAAVLPDTKEEEDDYVLPDAAPEELKQACAEWKRIVADLPSGILKTGLRDSAPLFNEGTMEPKLFIEIRSIPESNPAEKVLEGNTFYREELEEYLRKRYGRRIEVEFRGTKERTAGLRTVNIERQLEVLGIDFEEEDDGDDDV